MFINTDPGDEVVEETTTATEETQTAETVEESTEKEAE